MRSVCFITGCCGFIGSHLTERLLSEGWQVVGVDCFNDNYSVELKKANLDSFKDHKNFKFIEKDLASLTYQDVADFEISTIVHLAAQPGVRDSWGPDFSRYVHNNIQATQNLLEVAIRLKAFTRFVNGGSSSVYGDVPPESQNKPITEDSPTNPVSPYGVTKLTAEKLSQAYASNFGFSLVNLRFFTVYGPRQRPDMAFMKFILKAMRGEPITVYGDGTQKRDFTYIDDIVDGICRAITKGSGTYNLGRGKALQLKDALSVLRDSFPKLEINFEKPQKGDVPFTWADISRAKEQLGYNPNYDLEQGLINQIAWAKQHF